MRGRPAHDHWMNSPSSGQHTAHYSPVIIATFVDQFIALARWRPCAFFLDGSGARHRVGYATLTPAGRLRFDNTAARAIVSVLAAGPASLEHIIGEAAVQAQDVLTNILALCVAGAAGSRRGLDVERGHPAPPRRPSGDSLSRPALRYRSGNRRRAARPAQRERFPETPFAAHFVATPLPLASPQFVDTQLDGLRAGLLDIVSGNLPAGPRPDSLGQAFRLLPPGIADHLPDRYWATLESSP